MTSIYHSSTEPEYTTEVLQHTLWSGLYSDCKLVCQDGEIDTYRALLAYNSPVFYAMFTTGTTTAITGVVDLTNFTVSIIKELNRYCICGELFDCWNRCEDLLAVADYFDIDGMKDMITTCMGNRTDFDTEDILIDLCDKYNCDKTILLRLANQRNNNQYYPIHNRTEEESDYDSDCSAQY